jgi:general secretion pathway protein B
MSFILDALKKAEAERQRQRGPTLLELRVAAPRRRWPVWSVLIGMLLVVNIIVVLGTALRPRQPPEPLAAVNATAPAAAAAPASAAVVVVPTVLTTVPAVATASAAAASPPGGGVNSPSALATTGAVEATDAAALPVARARGSNPADDDPAVAPPTRIHRAPSAAEVTKTEVDLPSLSELGGTVPALRLDLHVYADRPADRYALINMHKAHEGDMLPEGARVVAIDRDGVELSYQGTEFMLRPQ